MTKRLTKEEFIARATSKHGNQYLYDGVDYVNNSVKVVIKCVKHNSDFIQSPSKHMAGQGCPICRYEKASKSLLKTNEEFIASAVKIHGDKYSYHSTAYTSVFNYVKIFCNRHQTTFRQKATNHLSGGGCPTCAREKTEDHIKSLVMTTGEFVYKARAVHGNLYDYSNTVYVRSATPVSIWCNRHNGMFEQSPNSHLAGIGCASCAKTGYSTNKLGFLYVLSCGDMTKIGITNISANDRATKVSKSYGSEFTVVKVYEFEDGSIPDYIETNILRTLRSKYERPKARFEGSSECFLSVDYTWLLAEINNEITKLAA